jgi:hypothetical protein
MTIYKAPGGSFMPTCRPLAGSLWLAAPGREPTKEVPIRCRGSDSGVHVIKHYAELRRSAAEKLTSCMLIPIAYAAVVAPFGSECDVHAKPSGGLTLLSVRTSCIQLERVSTEKLVVFLRLIAQRYRGVLPLAFVRSP